MGDGKTRNLLQICEGLSKTMNLNEEELAETYETSGQNRHHGRCGWARTWFMKAGILDSPKKGVYTISQVGKELLSSGETKITQKFLIEHYPSFASFARAKKKTEKHNCPSDNLVEPLDPMSQMEDAFAQINHKLIDDLLQYIGEQDPKFFEKLVVDLLVAMGYGGDFEDAAKVTQFSNDGGIDGIIKEDALGLDKVYLQAKRWKESIIVGAPDIHKFMGALMSIGASKGVYITTSSFSKAAIDVVASNKSLKLVLIDGKQLAKYMIKYNVGVISQHSFTIKRVDTGYFEGE
ncbi:MAG: restriction endonuclease [Muribaculaceae bacterium]|nr:restriction endonuclease [Muribaculaceae bacterium]